MNEVMDDLMPKLAVASQRINTYTGTDYSGIESLRREIREQGTTHSKHFTDAPSTDIHMQRIPRQSSPPRPPHRKRIPRVRTHRRVRLTQRSGLPPRTTALLVRHRPRAVHVADPVGAHQ
jgi:hypothetical protein